MAKTKKHPGTIERRGESLRVILYAGGQRHAFTLPTLDRKAAERFARDRHAELQRQIDRVSDGLPGAIKFSSLVSQYEREELPTRAPGTRRAYRDSLKPIKDYFIELHADPTIDRVHARHIHAFLAWRRVHRYDRAVGSGAGRRRVRQTEPVSSRTLQKDRAVLHRIFALAERMEYREGNPVARVPAPKSDAREPVLLTDMQYSRLLEECGDRPMLRMYALLLAESGMRAYSEALHLRWEDVDLQEGFVHVASGREGHRTKSGKGRYVPMTPALQQGFRDHFKAFRFAAYDGARSPWVFHHTSTLRHHNAGERIKDFRRAFNAAAKRAGIPLGFHRHDLRHRRVTTWMAEENSPALIKEAMGHSDIRVTMGYTHLAKQHLRQLVEKPPKRARSAG